jgi:hypothetical protein
MVTFNIDLAACRKNRGIEASNAVPRMVAHLCDTFNHATAAVLSTKEYVKDGAWSGADEKLRIDYFLNF